MKICFWVRSSVEERCSDKAEVEGSIPSAPKGKKKFYDDNGIASLRFARSSH